MKKTFFFIQKKLLLAMTCVLLCSAIILQPVILETRASYSAETVTTLQGGGRTNAQIRALGHDGSLTQTVANDQTFATLDFVSKYNLTAGYTATPVYIMDHYVLMNDGTVVTDQNSAFNSNGDYLPYPLRLPAGEGTFFGDVKVVDGVSYLGNVIDIGTAQPGGSTTYVFLTSTGHVYTLGDTNYGQAGTGQADATKYTTPKCVLAGEAGNSAIQSSAADSMTYNGEKYLSNIKQVSITQAGATTVFAVANTGAVYVWGDNSYGKLGGGDSAPARPNSSVPVRVLAGDGETYGGATPPVQTVAGTQYLSNIRLAQAGTNGCALITNDNKLYVLGTGGTHTKPFRVQVGSASSSGISFESLTYNSSTRKCITNVSGVAIAIANLFILVEDSVWYGGTPATNNNLIPLPAGEAAYEGDSVNGTTTGALKNIKYLWGQHASYYFVDNNGKLFVAGTNSDGRQYIGNQSTLSAATRMAAGDAAKHAGQWYYGSDAGHSTQQYFKFVQTPPTASNANTNAWFNGYVNGGVVYSKYNYEERPAGQSAPVTYLMDDTISQVLPLVGMELYQISNPTLNGLQDTTNGNRIGEVAFTANRNLDTGGMHTLSARITKNGYYRAYYSLGGNLQWYIDIHVTDILQNAIEITPENNSIEAGYDTAGKQAYINLKSDFTATRVPSLSAGKNISAMVTADGCVWTWGDEKFGDLGDGITSGNISTPTRVLAGEAEFDGSGNFVQYAGKNYLGNIVKVVCGDDHMLAIAKDGRVYVWGLNTSGQLGDGTTTNRSTPVRVLAGDADGTLGNSAYTETLNISGGGNKVYLKSVVDVGAGPSNSGFICQVSGQTKTRLYTCGSNTVGQLAISSSGATSVTTVKRVTAGAISKVSPFMSTVFFESTSSYETIATVNYPLNIKQVAFGTQHIITLTQSGNVYTAGSNSVGQLGTMTTTYNSGGAAAPFAVNVGTSTSSLSYVVSGETGRAYFSNTKLDVSPVGVSQYQTSRLGLITSIASSGNTSYAIGQGGCVVGWGDNSKGQLGNETTNNSPFPVYLKFGSKISGVSTVDYVSLPDAAGIISGGFKIFLNATDIYPGKGFLILRRSDGNVLGVGDNAGGQLGTTAPNANPSTSQIVNTLPGDYITLPTLSVPNGLLAAGADHMLCWAIISDNYRTMLSWGGNAAGQLGIDPVSVPKAQMPLDDVNDNITDIVLKGTTAKYILTSRVRNFVENPGSGTNAVDAFIPTAIDTRCWGNAASTLRTPQNPDGWLNHDINIYENGYYVAKYYYGDNDLISTLENDMSFWTGVVATSMDDLMRYNAVCDKQAAGLSTPAKAKLLSNKVDLSMLPEDLEKLYLIKPLDFIDLSLNASSINAKYYLRPVIHNLLDDSDLSTGLLPHVGPYKLGKSEVVTETLYIYGPKPAKGATESNEHYQYYNPGAEVLKMTPTQTFVNGSLTASTGLQALYDSGNDLNAYIRSQITTQVGTYTAMIMRPGGSGQLQKLVDIDTIDVLTTDVKLHVRQVVLGATSPEELVIPLTGFMTITNVNPATPNTMLTPRNITTRSGLEVSSVPYSDFVLPMSSAEQKGYRIDDVVPQYYTYDGFVMTDTNTTHVSSSRTAPGIPIVADYTDVSKEYWVTVYLKPATDPKDHNTDNIDNPFGVVSN